jgi:hypothetical protein
LVENAVKGGEIQQGRCAIVHRALTPDHLHDFWTILASIQSESHSCGGGMSARREQAWTSVSVVIDFQQREKMFHLDRQRYETHYCPNPTCASALLDFFEIVFAKRPRGIGRGGDSFRRREH